MVALMETMYNAVHLDDISVYFNIVINKGYFCKRRTPLYLYNYIKNKLFFFFEHPVPSIFK